MEFRFVNNNSNFYGNVESILPLISDKLFIYFRNVIPAAEEFIRKYASANDYVWISLRITCDPSIYADNYEIPRWHVDGIFGSKPLPKHIITLYGPPTRVLLRQEDCQERFNKIITEAKSGPDYFNYAPSGQNTCNTRMLLAKEFENEPLVDLKVGEAYTLDCGSYGATIHSEPHINDLRVFMSIVIAPKEEIAIIASRRGEKII